MYFEQIKLKPLLLTLLCIVGIPLLLSMSALPRSCYPSPWRLRHHSAAGPPLQSPSNRDQTAHVDLATPPEG